MKEFSIDHFAPAIIWWLNYISAVGREYIIGESSIKIPASEYLERSKTKDVELEYNHPVFLLKRFDIHFKDTSKNNNVVFEFKYIKEDSTRAKSEKQRVFDDLMRLLYFKGSRKKSYFLICGNQIHFKSSFEMLPLRKKISKKIKTSKTSSVRPKMFYGEWFSFDINSAQKVIDLNTKNNIYKSYYSAFKREYAGSYKSKVKGGKLNLPNKFKTKLVFLSQEIIDKNTPQTFKMGIWEVGN